MKRDGSQAASRLCYPSGGRQSGDGTANTVIAAQTRHLGKKASHSYCIIWHKRSPTVVSDEKALNRLPKLSEDKL